MHSRASMYRIQLRHIKNSSTFFAQLKEEEADLQWLLDRPKVHLPLRKRASPIVPVENFHFESGRWSMTSSYSPVPSTSLLTCIQIGGKRSRSRFLFVSRWSWKDRRALLLRDWSEEAQGQWAAGSRFFLFFKELWSETRELGKDVGTGTCVISASPSFLVSFLSPPFQIHVQKHRVIADQIYTKIWKSKPCGGKRKVAHPLGRTGSV